MPHEYDYTTISGSRSGHYGQNCDGLTASWQVLEGINTSDSMEEPLLVTIDLSLINNPPQQDPITAKV